MNLDDVLSNKPVERPETEPATDEKQLVADEPLVAAPSAAEAKAETPAPQQEAPKLEPKPEQMVPLSALLAERARRKEPDAAKPKTSIFEDEDKGIEERVAARMAPLEQTIFGLQLQLAKNKPGFDDAAMAYLKAAENDPVLRYKADNAPDPLEFVYREGKLLKELGDVGGDIEKYREKVTAAERTKYADLETRYKALEAENKTLKDAQEKRSKVPQSLNSEQSAASNTSTFSGPKSIKSILS